MIPIQLTPNFFLSELLVSTTATRKGISNIPNPIVTGNLYHTAMLLEEIRTLLKGKPITVLSGYRSPDVNAAVGGAMTSEHMTGDAVDFICPGFGAPLDIARAILASDIDFGQMIEEGNWLHISRPSARFKRQVMTAHFGTNGRVSYSNGLRK